MFRKNNVPNNEYVSLPGAGLGQVGSLKSSSAGFAPRAVSFLSGEKH